MLLISHPIVRYATIEAAAAVASANAADDPDWTYTVVASGDRFVVVIHDEDGNEVGAL